MCDLGLWLTWLGLVLGGVVLAVEIAGRLDELKRLRR